MAIYKQTFNPWCFLEKYEIHVHKTQMNTSVGGAINNIECTHGRHRHHARGTGYYPADDPIEGGFVDMRDHKLQTLQVSDVY